MTGVLIPKESIGKVDLLLGRAMMLAADRWDEVAGMIQEAVHLCPHPAKTKVLARLCFT